MTLFTAAAAAALEAPTRSLPIGVYSYLTEVQFDANAVGNRAPTLLLSLLRKILADKPNLVYCDAVADHINIDEFPSLKTDFDTMFSTPTSGGKLSCRFEIRSTSKSFHSIKIRAWDVWQKYHIWFKKSPGPIKRVPLAIMGLWVNVHPGFASSRSVLDDIKTDLLTNYPSHTAVLMKFGLSTTFTPPDMYLARGRVSGQYHANPPPVTLGSTNAVDTDAFIAYTSVADFDRSMILVTQVSSQKSPSSRKDPMFIPFAL
jgi:hypothetical protein